MAKLNNKNAVRYSLFHAPGRHDLSEGTRRSAWKSEESSERHDRQDRPPRRPSRDQDFLFEIPDEVFVGEWAENNRGERQPIQQQDRSSMPRSILKTSKLNTLAQSGLKRRHPKPFFTTSSSRTVDSDESSSNIVGENPKLLFQRHRDSILDLPRLALCFEPKIEHEGSVSLIPLSYFVYIGDEDELTNSLRSSEEL